MPKTWLASEFIGVRNNFDGTFRVNHGMYCLDERCLPEDIAPLIVSYNEDPKTWLKVNLGVEELKWTPKGGAYIKPQGSFSHLLRKQSRPRKKVTLGQF